MKIFPAMKTCALVLVCMCTWASTTGAVTIVDVKVRTEGGAEIDPASVLSFTSQTAGGDFDRSAVARDVKNLQKSGRFSFVETEIETLPDGVVLTYIVRSKPRIRSLRINGADYMGNKKVRDLLELGTGDLVDDATMAVHAQKVYEKYRKRLYPYARMTWRIEEDPETGLADVEVTVKEGLRAKVAAIKFIGNTVFRAKELKKHMRQKRRNILSWITGSGAYNPDDLAADTATIKQMYLDKGYLDVQVGEPIIQDIGRGRISITIPVKENLPYDIGTLQISGISVFPANNVERVVAIKPGDTASVADITTARRAIQDYYGSRGYIDTYVALDQKANPATQVADVSFVVREGRLAYIRDIQIRGNTRTKDKVIRRELSVYPGDEFDEVAIRRSERRLWNLGYFSYVGSTRERTFDPAQYDLTLEVEEQRTGQFMIGAGFSSVDKLIGFIELSQGNFDLFNWPPVGAGQKLKLRLQVGTERTDVELSFVEPWLFNRRLAFGVDVFSHDRRFLSDEYNQKNMGFSLSLSKPIAPNWRGTVAYGLEEIDVYDVSKSASDIIKAEEGRRSKSWMRLSVARDTRDSVFLPTRGSQLTLSSTLAGGFLGGETDIYKLEARGSQFFPLWFDHVLNVRGWSAVVEEYGDSEFVPIFDRLFLGGARTLRGFKYRDVGPRDNTGEPIGGRTAAFASAEYTVPIVTKLRFALFYDIGMVWEQAYHMDTELNSDWGIGIRIDVPGFPLRLDYAWPIDTSTYTVTGPPEVEENNDKPSGRFSFMIGYTY
ncbi:MAG: outer membrane protein assembly factor BamA [Spartobacteria bacterium]|nr:outer membrane protein assembly factor BamA [Spartobacteria bacterium]